MQKENSMTDPAMPHSNALPHRLGPQEAERITAPLLVVAGGETARVSAMAPDSVQKLAALVPHAETTVLAGASHLMPLEDPSGVARLIVEFAGRHPSAGGTR
jgi:pimeloyl-ACP methyl ester carboxylesterase